MVKPVGAPVLPGPASAVGDGWEVSLMPRAVGHAVIKNKY